MKRLGKGKGESPKLLIRVPTEIISALKEAAKSQGISYSEYVRNLLVKSLGKEKRNG